MPKVLPKTGYAPLSEFTHCKRNLINLKLDWCTPFVIQYWKLLKCSFLWVPLGPEGSPWTPSLPMKEEKFTIKLEPASRFDNKQLCKQNELLSDPAHPLYMHLLNGRVHIALYILSEEELEFFSNVLGKIVPPLYPWKLTTRCFLLAVTYKETRMAFVTCMFLLNIFFGTILGIAKAKLG